MEMLNIKIRNKKKLYYHSIEKFVHDFIQTLQKTLVLFLYLLYLCVFLLGGNNFILLFSHVLFNKQLKLVFWVVFLVWLLVEEILVYIDALNSPGALLKRITVVTEDSHIEVLIVEFKQARFSLSAVCGFVLNWSTHFILARVTGLSFLWAVLKIGFSHLIAGLDFVLRYNGFNSFVRVMETCNRQLVLLINKRLLSPYVLVLKRGESFEVSLWGIDLNLIIEDVFGPERLGHIQKVDEKLAFQCSDHLLK